MRGGGPSAVQPVVEGKCIPNPQENGSACLKNSEAQKRSFTTDSQAPIWDP
jgi:hypothetical protein